MVSKKISAVFAFTFVLAMIFVVNASALSSDILFSDNFNSGIASNWTNSGVTTSAGSAVFNSNDALTLSLSTAGYNNLVIRWAWMVPGVDGGSHSNFFLEYNDGSGWQTADSLNAENSWVVRNYNLPSVSNLQVRFRFDNELVAPIGNLENVTIAGDLLPLPSCSVDSLKDQHGNVLFNLNAYYFNQVGSFNLAGSANSNSGACVLQAVSTNRSGFSNWNLANPQSGWSAWDNGEESGFNFAQGTQTVCCKVDSSPCNGGNCALLTNVSCRDFCIDTAAPTMSYVNDNTNDCGGEENYWNGASIGFNWLASYSGCAPVAYYLVTLSNGTVLNISGTSFVWNGVQNGLNYNISVVPVDAAGNIGSSISSRIITIDNQAPVVTIQSPLAGWYNNASNLWLNETDVDVNLMNCSVGSPGYNNSIVCNSNVSFDVDNYCPSEGNCTIAKYAQDEACNIGTNNVIISLDRLPPNTTKFVGKPRVNASMYSDLASWVSQLVNGFFVSNETPITLTANDAGVGMGQAYYNLTYPNGTVVGPILYVGSFVLPNIDGKFTITYWSVDALNNTEVAKYEIDKLDNIAPVTTKTWGTPNYWNGSALWVTSNTVFNLSCADSEVGCDYTYYNINNNDDDTEGNQFSIDGNECAANFVEYYSIDRLGNTENIKNETDWLDNNAPLVRVVNPSFTNTSSCSMAVLAEILDSCVGTNESSVYVTLYYANGSVALTQLLPRTGNLNGVIFGGKPYSALLNTTGLPAGSYTLMVSAADMLGNVRQENRTIVLNEGIYVEYVSPSSCSITPGYAGNCSFTLNTCIRDSDSVSMWMDKLNGGKVAPTDVDATLWNTVGQAQEIGIIENGTKEFDPQPLRLNITSGCQNFNGWYKFNMTLGVPANVSTLLGGKYTINYTLSSYDEYSCDDS